MPSASTIAVSASTTRTGVHHGCRPARIPTGPPIRSLSVAATGSSFVGWIRSRSGPAPRPAYDIGRPQPRRSRRRPRPGPLCEAPPLGGVLGLSEDDGELDGEHPSSPQLSLGDSLGVGVSVGVGVVDSDGVSLGVLVGFGVFVGFGGGV